MKTHIIKATLTVLGDNTNTDVLHPSRFFSLDPKKLASGFLANDKKGPKDGQTVIVGGKNFGIGSSRESTILGLKHSGVQAIAAVSFARIFMRNAANAGIRLYLLESKIPDNLKTGTGVELDTKTNILKISGTTIKLNLPDAYLQKVIKAGGLVAFLNKHGKAK